MIKVISVISLVIVFVSCKPTEQHCAQQEDLRKHLSEEQKEIYKNHVNNFAFRRVLTNKFFSDLKTYDYLLDQVVFLGQCFRALKIRSYTLDKSAEGRFLFDDGQGFTGTLSEWAKIPGERLYYVKVSGQGPFGLRVKANVLMKLSYFQCATETVETELEVWVKMSGFMGALAKLIIPLAGDAFDRKIDSLMSGGREIAQRITQDPQKFIFDIKSSSETPSSEVIRLKNFLKKIGKLRT